MKKETGFDNLLIDSARMENSYFEGLELITDDGRCSSSEVTSSSTGSSNDFEDRSSVDEKK